MNSCDVIKKSADLVKRMGSSLLPNGKTLSELFVVGGISLSEAAAPILAAYLSNDLIRKKPQSFYLRNIKPFLSKTKSKLRSFVPFPRSTDGCLHWPEKPVGLFLGFSGYIYRDVLEPVVRYLKGNHHMGHVVLHDDGRFQETVVKLQGDGVQSVWEHWDSGVHDNELKIRCELSEAVAYLKTIGDISSIIFDPEERELLWPKMERTLKWFWSVYLLSLVPYLALAQHILKVHRPDIIISPDVADPRTRIFCMVGHLLGIPSLEIQFGLYAEDSVEWRFCVADRVAVWGEESRKVISGHGVPNSRITLTGSPRFDCSANVESKQTGIIRSRLKIADGQVMVLFASYHLSNQYSEYCDYDRLIGVKRAIFNVAGRIEGLSLVVKPHPVEDVRELERIAKESKGVIFANQNDDIRELIKACDVFITFGSTSTMDALIAKKTVIYPDFPGAVWWDDVYLNSNVTTTVRSEEELACVLKQIVDGRLGNFKNDIEPSRQIFLEDWIYQADGQAAARIADLTIQMVGLE